MAHTVFGPNFIPLGGLKYLKLRISLKRLQIEESYKGKYKYSLNYNTSIPGLQEIPTKIWVHKNHETQK